MNQRVQSVKGMHDLLPEQLVTWHHVENTLRNIAGRYGYQEIRTPLIEKSVLFQQSIGDQTDIVEKEMYTFTDRGEESLSLRPEATASTVRACNQHGLLHNQSQRLWYLGPMFRRERPQKGRYRQFHQFGIEAFGWPGPDVDAEVMLVAARIWNELGIKDVRLLINTLGNTQSRQSYRNALYQYLDGYRDQLDDDSLRRLDKNPLRILDSKIDRTQQLIDNAPNFHEHLDKAARAHLDQLCQLIESAGIKPLVSEKLVRGLDYYTSTVFEWVTDGLGAQNTLCAGGRYDNLVERRGGKATPAIGFALGLERLVEIGIRQGQVVCRNPPDIYVLQVDASVQSITQALAERLREHGLCVTHHHGGGKLKTQMKRADQSGAKLAILFGEAEAERRCVRVKLLRESGDQHEIAEDRVVYWCQGYLDELRGSGTSSQTRH